MDFIPYKINEALENVFIQIPVELFDNELIGKSLDDYISEYNQKEHKYKYKISKIEVGNCNFQAKFFAI